MGKKNEVKINGEPSVKNRMTALMLCWFLGIFGVHRLYLGKIGTGFLMLYGTIASLLALAANPVLGGMCVIVMAAFVVCDFVAIAFGELKDCYGNYVTEDKLN